MRRGLLELRPMGMSLEEIFLKLTTKEDAEAVEEAAAPEASAPEASGEAQG